MTPGALLLFLACPQGLQTNSLAQATWKFCSGGKGKRKGAVEKLNFIESQSKKSRLTSAAPGHN